MPGAGGLDVTFLNNVTRTKFIPALKNVLYNQSPLFNRLFVNGRVQTFTGTALQWDVVITKHASVGRFTGYDVFANQPINPTVQAQLSEGSYYAALAISGTEKRKNTGNMEKLLDALKIQHDNAISTLKDQMYTDAFGAGGLVGGRAGLTGLDAGVNASNTYANIDRSVAANASWKANVDAVAHALANLKDPTSVDYLPSIMRTMYTNATHDHAPDIIITTKTIYNIYQDIAGINNLRFDNDVANLGFGGVQFGPGVSMLFDDFCTDKYMYFLHIADWNVFVYSGANFDMPEEGWMRPANQDAYITQILWSDQMRLDSPWHQGKMSAIG
jgi:hypothetical protein